MAQSAGRAEGAGLMAVERDVNTKDTRDHAGASRSGWPDEPTHLIRHGPARPNHLPRPVMVQVAAEAESGGVLNFRVSGMGFTAPDQIPSAYIGG